MAEAIKNMTIDVIITYPNIILVRAINAKYKEEIIS